MELEEPYRSLWKKGYLVTNPEGRKNVILYNSKKDRTTTSYARYLKSVQLGYIVPDEFEVDHKDDNKKNDTIDNLQLLSGKDNKNKENERYLDKDQVLYGYDCANCNESFVLTERLVKMRIKQGVEMAFCSRSCSSAYNYNKNNSFKSSGGGKQIDENIIKKIRLLRKEGKSSYDIAAVLKIARNTVMKYW